MPVLMVTEAVAGALELQLPPEAESVRVISVPRHKPAGPEMAEGVGRTVMTDVAAHAEPSR